MRLPVITACGGINAAGRSSFHHAYQRLVIDALPEQDAQRTWQSLAQLMGVSSEQSPFMRDHTLIRELESNLFDPDKVPHNRAVEIPATPEQPSIIRMRRKDLPESRPAHWQCRELADGWVEVELQSPQQILLPQTRSMSIRAAGQLPTGFDPASLYPARHHPRGLQLMLFAAADAVSNLGMSWASLSARVAPDQIAVYAGSAMAQLDEAGNGGLLSAAARGKRVSSKQLALGLAEMPADFINAYLLGNLGSTGLVMGACATFLYNLKAAVQDIKNGRARIAIVGASEAPLTPDVFEGYASMGALATDDALRRLDGSDAVDYRRASRPFANNCGFTLAESAQCIVLMDDELALETGAQILGSVPEVHVNADGFKKSISGPGVGNYLTLAKTLAGARALFGEDMLRRQSFVQAHGTSTPQNRVSESEILSCMAREFGMQDWPVLACKSYLGHSIAAAAGDQLSATLGVWHHGVLPGIANLDQVADDVCQRGLSFSREHRQIGSEERPLAFLNSKGFGGNNASAMIVSPDASRRLLRGRHGSAAMLEYQRRWQSTEAVLQEQEQALLNGQFTIDYRFGEGVLAETDLQWEAKSLAIKGHPRAVDLGFQSDYEGWLKNATSGGEKQDNR